MSGCPSCGEDVIKPYGYSKSNILIIGDRPEKDEYKSGRPFAGATGMVLRKELAEVGIDLFSCRMANLWLHTPNKDENCFDAGLNVVLEEAKGKEAILLVGSAPVEYFTGYKVSDVSGLQVDVDMFSAPIVFAMVMPTIVYHGTVGEVRMAIEKFADKLESEGLDE